MNSLMKLLGLLAITLLAACQGPSGGGTESVTVGAEPGLNIAIFDNTTDQNTNRIDENNQARVEIYLTDENNSPYVDQLVNLTATSGILNQSVVLTDDNGRASALIYAPDFEGATAPGTVSVIYENESESLNYEFLSSDSPIAATTGILVEMQVANSAGEVTNQIPSDEYAYVTLTLLDDSGQPMADKLIFVSVTSGSIINNTNSVLTDINGQGVVQILSPDITFGEYPGYLTASSDSAVADAVFPYEFYATNVNTDENPVAVGSITFQSPPSADFMSLKGTGDIAYPTSSRLTFKVLTQDGSPLEGVALNFGLSTEVGGIKVVNPDGNLTSATGEISVDVLSGDVATPVRVIASYDDPVSGETIYTQSSELTITSGIPDQNSMSISIDRLAPEALRIDGVTVNVTARIADRYNNPVKDGTTINFTTETGKIGDSQVGACKTVDSKCSVVWESQGDRPVDNRNSIMAFVIGNESFYDRNGNGLFDVGDDFDDKPEAFLDADENGVFNYVSNPENPAYLEIPYDYNNNSAYDSADGIYNGYPCNDSARCPANPEAALIAGSEMLTHVFSSNVLVTASSYPNVSVYESTDRGLCIDSDTGKIRPACSSIIDWGQASGSLTLSDSNAKTLSLIIEDQAALCFEDSSLTTRAIDVDGSPILDPTDAACVVAIRQSAATGTSVNSDSGFTGTTIDGELVNLDDIGITTYTEFSDLSASTIPSQRGPLELQIIVTPAKNDVEYSGFYDIKVKTPQGSERVFRVSFVDVADF